MKKDKTNKVFNLIKIPKYIYDLCEDDIKKFCGEKSSHDLENCMIKKFKKNKLRDKCTSAIKSWLKNKEGDIKNANKNMNSFARELYPKINKKKKFNEENIYTEEQVGIISKIYEYINILTDQLYSIGVFVDKKLTIFDDENISWVFKLLVYSFGLLTIINFIPKCIIDTIFNIINYIVKFLITLFGKGFLYVFKKISESFTVLVTSSISECYSIIKTLTSHYRNNPSQFGFIVVILVILLSILARIDK
jgi:hypothetical protein